MELVVGYIQYHGELLEQSERSFELGNTPPYHDALPITMYICTSMEISDVLNVNKSKSKSSELLAVRDEAVIHFSAGIPTTDGSVLPSDSFPLQAIQTPFLNLTADPGLSPLHPRCIHSCHAHVSANHANPTNLIPIPPDSPLLYRQVYRPSNS